MRLVIAIGGNALLQRGQPPESALQRANVATATAAIAAAASDHEIIITHGNGPQVGLLALQSEAYREVAPYPLDVLGAESEGMIGYLIEEDLRNALPDREVATLLTQVLVDPHDPAFTRPSKPIGPVYSPADAQRLSTERGWTMAPDGPQWRRVGRWVHGSQGRGRLPFRRERPRPLCCDRRAGTTHGHSARREGHADHP